MFQVVFAVIYVRNDVLFHFGNLGFRFLVLLQIDLLKDLSTKNIIIFCDGVKIEFFLFLSLFSVTKGFTCLSLLLFWSFPFYDAFLFFLLVFLIFFFFFLSFLLMIIFLVLVVCWIHRSGAIDIEIEALWVVSSNR